MIIRVSRTIVIEEVYEISGKHDAAKKNGGRKNSGRRIIMSTHVLVL